ncbi:hypothetical protein LF1_59410 [Rubripirellula obstinata]|uniref:Uncharacterized protein n=1 Tax=Rubripirellula obstinata TaxID=406547 RepID=A0A5B1CBR5_9BACT|nr:hypothetical protein LF1_59410 [Rubripirellula obstinata]
MGLAAVSDGYFFRPHPVILDVIRLSRGHLLPASRPAGHIPCSTKTALPPTLDLDRSAEYPAGHQPTPDFQCSNNADVPDALRGTNQRLTSNARLTSKCRMHCVASTNACLRVPPLLLTAKTCFTGNSLLRFQHGDCHPRGRSPRPRTALRWCVG